jgi:hypothetical protein
VPTKSRNASSDAKVTNLFIFPAFSLFFLLICSALAWATDDHE